MTIIDLGVLALIILICFLAYRLDRWMTERYEKRREAIRLVYSAKEADKPDSATRVADGSE